MTHTLSAKEQALAKVFSDDYVFKVPGYQRPYSWGVEQAQELLDDLQGALEEAPANLADALPYFLGSIVLIKREAVPDATVVDGQQRLTTLTLLLSAIRATVSDAGAQAGITQCIYEKGNIVFGTQARYRLSLRERDRDFFRTYVQHEDGLPQLVALLSDLPDAQARLRANAQLFMRELAALGEAVLKRLAQFIVTRCYLVIVATPDLDSAYRIFGVLNSRGLDLSATDILKAEIVGSIEASERDVYTRKWEDAEEDLGREAFGELFSHLRMVYRKAKPKGTLLKEFREHVPIKERPEVFMDKVLLPMAGALGEILDADYASGQHAKQVNEHLQWLNKLEFKDWLPPALAFFVRKRNEPEAMLAFFSDLERLAYSMLVRKVSTNGRIERFSDVTSAVEKDAVLGAVASPLQLTSLEQQETYDALNGPLYETHSTRALSVILLRLDRLMADGAATYQYDVISVEHVLPQQPAPRSQWLQWMPNARDRLHWTHRLGNLALLSRKKNSSASNYEFAKKKTAYFAKGGVSSFALTTQVLSYDEWSARVIEQRHDELLGTLEAHWRLEGRKTAAEINQERLQQLNALEELPVFELESSKHQLKAEAREVGHAFVVLAGSQARPSWVGPPHGYQLLYSELRERGALKHSSDGACLLFAADVPFASPSAAAATVLGRPDNGRLSWRLKGTTITYAAWQDNLPSERAASGRSDVDLK
jgi:hypothetical protein